MQAKDHRQFADLPLREIQVDPALTQPRVGMDNDWVASLVELLELGETLDPIAVFEDEDGTYWLGDGYHRYAAYEQAGQELIPAVIHQGNADAAYLHSVEHNLKARQNPLTKRDRKAIARRLLEHPEWREQSLRAIANYVGLSHETIRQLRGDRNVIPIDRAKDSSANSSGGDGVLPLPNIDARPAAPVDAAGDDQGGDGKKPRVAQDYYPTPPSMTRTGIRACWRQETPTTIGTVIEPAAGDGAIVRVLQEWGAHVVSNEPYCSGGAFVPDWAEDASSELFWEMLRDALAAAGRRIDTVVMNPPYESELMLPMFRHAWRFCDRGVLVHLRLSYLEPCANRAEFLKSLEDHVRAQVVVSPRPQYRIPQDATEKAGKDNVTSAWMWVDKQWSWKAIALDPPFQFVFNWQEFGAT